VAFEYAGGQDPVRVDLAEAHRATWRHVAAPGTWLRGSERVAIAAETRAARDCALCRARREALSPAAVDGVHDVAAARPGDLPPPLLDAVHRVTSDPARLSESAYRGLLAEGISPEQYVEALGVAVLVISVDAFQRALGLPLEPLPEPLGGEPSRARPEALVEGQAWVPMQEARRFARELGLPMAANVLRALSLVPAEVHAWRALSDAQYLSSEQMLRFDRVRAIDRSQIELVAGRVSALNECFY